jgi:type II secretory pathway pseudopilin PulG
MEQPTTSSAPKFAFLYLLSLFTLLLSSISVGMIIFQIINKYIFDALEPFNVYSQEPLKFAISALIIATPIFLFSMRQIQRSLFKGTLAKESPVRRWLSYFVLLVSAVVMIFWIIMTINDFLSGGLSLKVGLKTLTVLAIAAGIFSFYFYDIRRQELVNKKDKIVAAYGYIVLAVIAITFTASLFIVESPRETRNRKLDEATLSNFSTINSALNEYYSKNGKLPDTLETLKAEANYLVSSNLIDPTTKEQYNYKITGDKEYELCATFKSANKDQQQLANEYFKESWSHDTGYQCLSQKITTEKGKTFVPTMAQ